MPTEPIVGIPAIDRSVGLTVLLVNHDRHLDNHRRSSPVRAIDHAGNACNWAA